MATNLRLKMASVTDEPSPIAPPQVEPRRMTAREGAIAGALGIYLLMCGGLTLQLLAHVWSGSLALVQTLFPGALLEEAHLPEIQPFTYAACGAVLGAIMLCFRGLHKHAVVQGTFRSSFSGSYLLGPWAAGLIGIAMYAMLRGGLLAFGGEQAAPDAGGAHAYLALGIMTGFSWERMLARIDDGARQMFGSRRLRGEPVRS